jgi:hypothetical protein
MYKYSNTLLALSFSLICQFFLIGNSLAENSQYTQWVPKHWKLIKAITGDLNNDKLADTVLVIEEQNQANIKINDGMGSPELNTNPRKLMVLFKTTKTQVKVLETANFIPSQDDAESTCLTDPFEAENIQVKKGTLKINLNYWLSCGSWGVNNHTFTFKYNAKIKRFELIGFDSSSFMRNSGELSESSKNFLTGKLKTTTGLSMFEDEDGVEPLPPPKTTWSTFNNKEKFYLDTMKSDCYKEEKTPSWCD